MKTIFPLAVLAIFFSLSFSVQKPDRDNIGSVKIDHETRVAVAFVDKPILTVDCGLALTKVTYKFRLVNNSRFSVHSKNGLIKIQFTCPNETFKKNFILNEVYHLKITPLYSFYTAKDSTIGIIDETGDWDIPVYDYAG